MEQSLVESSKYKLYLQSLDSRFADQRSCNNSEFKLNLPHPLKNIMRIRMASIELPLVEYLFSEQYGNLTMAVRIGANPTFIKIIPLSEGNYSAAELMDQLQSRLQAIHSGFTVTINGFDGKCMIRNSTVGFELYTGSFKKSIATRPSHWGLGYYLGFRDGRVLSSPDNTGNYSVMGVSPVNVQQSQYYLLQLFCPESVDTVTHRLFQDGYVSAFAKIILKDGYFTVAFDDNSNLLRKEFTFLAPVTIPYFTVKLLNPFGEPVDMHNVDWSITVECTEVVNSVTYTALSRTYQR